MTFTVSPLAVQGKLKHRIMMVMTPENTQNTTISVANGVSLRKYSTMRLGGKAAYATGVSNREAVIEAYRWAQERNLPVIPVGSGSNIIWRDEDFQGLLIVNQIPGFDIQMTDATTALVTIGAGENWDKIVGQCVAAGLSGIEGLSFIPGTAGATPVQNVGAYGQEIANTLVSVDAYDTQTKNFVTIATKDCAFGYRTSRFKTSDRGRFFICSITLQLTKTTPQPPFYNALQKYFDEHNIHDFSPASIRKAVIAIRSSKLPDPNVIANNGSFFANPIVAPAIYEAIATTYDADAVPHWPTKDDQVKLSAAWLVDQAGFKDFHDPETGMATWHLQPLVLVNEKASTTQDLITFRQKILDAVKAKFNIILEQEPELLPKN
jgi:UDP-N-acetylmuramate dehydrogenase